MPSIILPLCELLTTKLRFSASDGRSLRSKDSPIEVVNEDGKLPSQVEEAPTTVPLICHSNNGMTNARTNKINPRLARRKGVKLRSMMLEWSFE